MKWVKNACNLLIWLLLPVLIAGSCGKKGSDGGGGGNTVTEENLSIAIDPDAGGTVMASLGAAYDFKVLVKSKMPASGVNIEVVCTKDADNSIVSSQTLTGSAASINVSVTNLQPGVLCTVKVKVTSVAKPSNTTSINFKVAHK